MTEFAKGGFVPGPIVVVIREPGEVFLTREQQQALFWTRKLTRRERLRGLFSLPYLRQTRLLLPLIQWWLNRTREP